MLDPFADTKSRTHAVTLEEVLHVWHGGVFVYFIVYCMVVQCPVPHTHEHITMGS